MGLAPIPPAPLPFPFPPSPFPALFLPLHFSPPSSVTSTNNLAFTTNSSGKKTPPIPFAPVGANGHQQGGDPLLADQDGALFFFSSSDFSHAACRTLTKPTNFSLARKCQTAHNKPHTPTSISLEAHPVENLRSRLIDTSGSAICVRPTSPSIPERHILFPSSRRQHSGTHNRFGSLLHRGSSSLLPRFTRPEQQPR